MDKKEMTPEEMFEAAAWAAVLCFGVAAVFLILGAISKSSPAGSDG